MGFFNAAFRLGAIQGFQDRQEEIAEEQEELLEEDRRIAAKAISRIENVKAKRKQLDQNVNNMFELTSSLAKDANPDAYKNMLKQWVLTHRTKLTEDVARRLAGKSSEEINAFMPAEEPATESPPETKEEESGPGFLAAVFSPSARADVQREEIRQKPAGVSEADWKAALAGQDIPAYGAPSQPVSTPERVKEFSEFTQSDTKKAEALLAKGVADMTQQEIVKGEAPGAKLYGTIYQMLKQPDRSYEGNPLAREYNSRNITELPSDVRTLVDLTNDDNVADVLDSLKKIGVKETIKELQKKDASTPSNNTQRVQSNDPDDMVENTAELKAKIEEKIKDLAIQLTPADRQALKQPKVPKAILDKIGI
jgi:hypothetical protein